MRNPDIPNAEPGLAGVTAFTGRWFDTVSDTRFSVENAFAAGDRVAGRCTLEIFQQMGVIPVRQGAVQ